MPRTIRVRRTKLTSQWFMIAERPPATDLRGGNTSEDSFTKSIANLVVAYVVDFQSDFLPRPLLKIEKILFEAVEDSLLREKRSQMNCLGWNG